MKIYITFKNTKKDNFSKNTKKKLNGKIENNKYNPTAEIALIDSILSRINSRIIKDGVTEDLIANKTILELRRSLLTLNDDLQLL